MITHLTRLSTAAIFCIMPHLSLAEEGGTLTVTVDGKAYDFTLWTMQSDWSGPQGFTSVNIYSQPSEAAKAAGFTQFTLAFTLFNGAADGPEASLTQKVGDGAVSLFANTDQSDITVALDAAAFDGDFMKVAGTATMMMGPSSNWGIEIDTSAPTDASATFDVILGPLE